MAAVKADPNRKKTANPVITRLLIFNADPSGTQEPRTAETHACSINRVLIALCSIPVPPSSDVPIMFQLASGRAID
jgi:hypothetical protein